MNCSENGYISADNLPFEVASLIYAGHDNVFHPVFASKNGLTVDYVISGRNDRFNIVFYFSAEGCVAIGVFEDSEEKPYQMIAHDNKVTYDNLITDIRAVILEWESENA